MRVPLAVSGTVRNIPEEAAIAWRGVVGHRVYELMHVGQDVSFHVIHELDLEEIDLDHLPSTESYQQKVPGHTHPGHSNPNPNPNPNPNEGRPEQAGGGGGGGGGDGSAFVRFDTNLVQCSPLEQLRDYFQLSFCLTDLAEEWSKRDPSQVRQYELAHEP